MSDLILNYPTREARELVVEAFDRTDGISEVEVSDFQIVGKTGVSFPRILWSYGETITVDLGETPNEGETRVSVRGKKNVPINIGANPDKFQRRFVEHLNQLR